MQAKKTTPETAPNGVCLSHALCFFLFACRASSAHIGADGSLPSVFPVSTSPPIHSGPRLMFYKRSQDHVTLLLETSHRLLVSEKKNQIPCRSLPSSLIPSAPTASLNYALTWSLLRPCSHDCSTVLLLLQRATLLPPQGLSSSGSQHSWPLCSYRLGSAAMSPPRIAFLSPSGIFCLIFRTALVSLYAILSFVDLFPYVCLYFPN